MIYIVTFDQELRSQRTTKHFVYHCEAKNAKEAKEICKANWPRIFGLNPHIPHQFHMAAVRSRSQNIAHCGIITWNSDVIRGADCLDKFYCTGWTNWKRP